MSPVNLAFAGWNHVLIDPKPTTALLDWLTRHHYIVETGNESYRFRYSISTDKAHIKLRGQAKVQEEIDALI